MLGPERLPKTARTLGHLFGRLQRYVTDVKADINREMELEELKKLQAEVKTAAREFEPSVATARAGSGGRRPRRRSEPQRRGRGARRRHAAERRAAGGSTAVAAAAVRYRRRTRREARAPGRAAGRRRCRASSVADERPRAMSNPSAAPDGPQETFISHLIELRTRLVRAIVAVLVVLLCLFPWAKEIYAVLAAAAAARCCRRARR